VLEFQSVEKSRSAKCKCLTLGSYPYLYECRDNFCESSWCSSDSQCSTYFQQMETAYPGQYVNLGCVDF